MSSFFTAPASQRKRKRTEDRAAKPRKRPVVERGGARGQVTEQRKDSRQPEQDESVSGSESEDDDQPEAEEGSESEATSEEDETGAERRIRLAQRYLDNIRQEVDETGFDAADLDKDLIAARLKQDVDEAQGRQFRLIASSLDFTRATQCSFRSDTHSTTGVAVCQPYVYTVSKDKTLIKWQVLPPSEEPPRAQNGKSKPPQRKIKQLAFVRGVKINALAPQQHGHSAPILSVAASPDGKYVATGGADKKLIIWSSDDLRPLKTFTTHRDGVTALKFAPKSSSQSSFGTQLFSASMDRCLKTYSLSGEDSLAYVETLFGHQDHVLDVSAMTVDQCVSVGARDRSARLWRVVDETQLKFLGDSSRSETYQTGSLDCVAALPPHHFVTGTDSGAIALWSIHKKKALTTIQAAHGVDEPLPMEAVTSESDPKIIGELKKDDNRRPVPRGITALASMPGTDVILSGSWNGWIKAWKLSDDKRDLLPLGNIGKSETEVTSMNGANGHGGSLNGDGTKQDESGPVRGIINSLAVFERRAEITNEFGGRQEGHCQGLCIVAGTGKEPRLGRWMKLSHGRNGAVVLEVPLKAGI